MEPLVVIRCLAYNHEKYIEDCLSGFVMQKTSFHFIAIVHDDASTDRTPEIIKKYAEKYPDIIKPILEVENQYSKHDGSLRRIMDEAIPSNAKYIAMCEGDDYWIDPYKLQKQVDFMEKNRDYSFCFHDSFTLVGNKMHTPRWRYKRSQIVPIEDIILNGGLFVPTASILMRGNIYINRPEVICKQHIGDYPLQIYLSSKGKVFYMHDAMCVYRFGAVNSWSERKTKMSLYQRIVLDCKEIALLDAMNEYLEEEYDEIFKERKRIYLAKSCNRRGKYRSARKMIQGVRHPWKYIGKSEMLKSCFLGRLF